MRFLCGCGKCSLTDFLSNGCPNPWERSRFPLLNIRKFNVEKRLELLARLMKEAEEVSTKFGSLSRQVYRSLKDKDVNELSLFLLPQQAFLYMDEKERIQLQANITKASNVAEVLKLLNEKYISWFNHPLLGSILKEFKVCEAEYQDYVDKHFTPYLKKSLFEIPAESLDSTDIQGSGKFILKLNVPPPKDSLKADILLPLRHHVASSFGIAINAFRIYSYDKGCIQIAVSIPILLFKEIFPLPSNVLSLLGKFSYQNVHIKAVNDSDEHYVNVSQTVSS